MERQRARFPGRLRARRLRGGTRGQARGQGVLFVAFLGYAVPNFVLAILLLLVFSYTLHWLPSAGSASLLHYVMPTVALAAYFIAALTRSGMLMVSASGTSIVRIAEPWNGLW